MKGIKIGAALVVLGLGVSAGTTQASPHYGGDLCAYDEFKCQKVKRSDTWAKLFPDEHQREMVKRLNRMNVPVINRSWIVIPTNFKDLEYLDLSPFPKQLDEPTGKSHLIVDLSDQAFGAYDASGQLVYWGPMSGGKGYCEDTNSYCRTVKGSFKITRKQGPECVSSKFPLETDGGAPMAYCMHFYRGFAMHGALLPGKHASHGCVRLFQADAKWLSLNFAKIDTPVKVQE
jgi:L,D-transpeptidase ErfK/SrfK